VNLWPGAGYIALAFLSGSIPWSWIIGRLMGTDIRMSGSGNSGATNLARICGRPAGIAGMIMDAVKGALPVYLVRIEVLGAVPDIVLIASLAAVASVLGHVFSPWLGFKGGKGVATTLGSLLVLAPATIGAAFGVFLIVFLLGRYMSLASISGAISMIPAAILLNRGELPVQIVVTLVAVLVVLRHISNIRRLLRGEEKRFWGRGSDGGR